MRILHKFFSIFLLCKTDLLRNEVICCRSNIEGTSSSSTKHDDQQPNNLPQMFNDLSLNMNSSKKLEFDNLKDRELTRTKVELDDQLVVDGIDYFSRHDHAKEILKISDESYAEEIQFQEVLLYSSTVDGEIDNDNKTLLRNLKHKETFEEGSFSSSQSKHFYCAICMEAKPIEEMFDNRICSHSFCEDCVGSYLAAKIQQNIAMVNCPDPNCNGIFEPYDCISIIPKEVFERWENALCENSTSYYSFSSSQSEHFYCAICMEAKPIKQMFDNRICSHSFCEDCVGSYLAAKIQENIAMVNCPDPNCNGVFEPYDCISIIPKKVFERWENALFELFESSSYFSFSSSQSEHFYCAICMEDKPIEVMFDNRICSHSFCEDCVGSYLAAKIQENIAMVKCPDPKCNDILKPCDCISIIPKEVFERWENALCENSVLASQKIYCAYNDCSAMLVNALKGVVTNTECPHCHRLFCAQCKVSWHAGVDCREFQSLKVNERAREDLMAMELAKIKRWKRCPNCSIFVEKKNGCNHIRCRCRHEFCYSCGSNWKNYHHACAAR